MAIRATERRLGDIVILDLAGSATGESRREVEARVSRLLEKGEKNILMNLRGVTFFDADWLQLIARSYRATKDADAQLKLLIANRPHHKKVLHLCKMDRIIACFDNETESIAGFRNAF